MRNDRAIAARFAWSRFVITAFLHVADAAFQIYGRLAERGAAVQLGHFLPKPRPSFMVCRRDGGLAGDRHNRRGSLLLCIPPSAVALFRTFAPSTPLLFIGGGRDSLGCLWIFCRGGVGGG